MSSPMLCRNDLKVLDYLSKPFDNNELDLSGMFFQNLLKYLNLYLMRLVSFVTSSHMFRDLGNWQLWSKQVLPPFLPLAMSLVFQKRMYVAVSWC